MTKGELVLTIITIVGSLTLGLWVTILLKRKVKRKGLKMVATSLLSILTLVTTIALIPAVYFLRDKVLFIGTADDCNDKIEIFVGQYWDVGTKLFPRH